MLYEDWHYEEFVLEALENDDVEEANEMLQQISDAETRCYLCDQYSALKLDEAAENWARREHKAYVDGMGW